jgi:hypothetical protein
MSGARRHWPVAVIELDRDISREPNTANQVETDFIADLATMRVFRLQNNDGTSGKKFMTSLHLQQLHILHFLNMAHQLSRFICKIYTDISHPMAMMDHFIL